MEISWALRIDLFRYALLASLAVGVICPLVGTLLWLRRTSFFGITLPQFSAAGVVLGYVVLPWWIQSLGLGGLTLDEALGDPHTVTNYLLAWASVACLGGLFALVWLGRVERGSEVGRVAAAFAIANAATYVFGRLSPVGQSHVEELLHGEVLGVGLHECETILIALSTVLVVLLLFRRELVLVSFDLEFARVLGKRALGLEILLHLLCTLTVAVGTIIVGPTMLFGLLVLPPLAARPFSRSMGGFFLLSVGCGALAVLLGVLLAFEADLPLGASIVAAATVLLVPGVVARRLH